MAHEVVLFRPGTAELTPFLSALTADGSHRCTEVEWRSGAETPASACRADLVLLVAVPTTSAALEMIRHFQRLRSIVPTFALVAADAGKELLEAAANAADDFSMWPTRVDELRLRVRRLLGSTGEDDTPAANLIRERGLSQLVGNSPAFVELLKLLPRFARSGLPVLIMGETGTGKELFARALHHVSGRRTRPLVAVDCASIPDHLVENELFGHRKGAFTDASQEQNGLVAVADGGTLFLDEVDALSMSAQAKLLRLIQERTFRPLGSEFERHADVNIIAASNHDIDALVDAKRFRADLFFRLNVLHVELPALRNRPGDVDLLAEHFARTYAAGAGRGRVSLSPAVRRRLRAHDWPGNVRELQNVIQRAIVLCEGDQIEPAHIVLSARSPQKDEVHSFRQARAAAVASFERRYIEDLLKLHDGNVTRAALEAGKDRRVFGRLMKRHGIDRRAFVSS